MGKRSGTETVVDIIQAFLAQGTWSQAELARRIGISPEAVRRTLYEMMDKGIPLEREEDPPQVFWSVPRRWFPGGVFISSEDAEELLRQLSRAPRTKRRDALMAKIVEGAKGKVARRGAEAVVAPQASEAEESFLRVVEDSAARSTSLRMRYYAASRGLVEQRHVSVQRVMATRPARFVGMCHRDDRLKWFRVDNVTTAKLDDAEAFRAAASEEVDRFIAESLDGFHQGVEPQELRFRVSGPDARWVANNLIEGMTYVSEEGGIVVTARTSAPLRVARFVVGLGGSARVESEELGELVVGLARGALGNGCSGTDKGGSR